MPYVNSTAIQHIDYNPATQTLYITFKGGREYPFCGVPQSVYQAFLNAPSKGEFYNDHIKDRYQC